MTRILVVEDEADIRQLIQMHLSREGMSVQVAENGEIGLKLLEESAFDLAVLDWMLPGLSGLDICRKIAGSLPVLMVTARADTSDIVLGLEVGADDYITKPFEIPIFLARVRALLRRSKSLASGKLTGDWLELEGLRMNVAEHKALLNGEELKLTASEFKLLSSLLESQGKVLSRDRLIRLVQGADVNVTDRTIDTHVFGLRKKLGASADLIETIRGVGYRVKAE
jgi:two-component system phosphate regulon response regulator PhoB